MKNVKVSRSKTGKETFVTLGKKKGESTTVVYTKGKISGNPKVLKEKKEGSQGTTSKKAKEAPSSAYFEQAKKKAEDYRKDPEKAKRLAEEVWEKSKKFERKKGILRQMWENINLMYRCIRAYFNGDYKEIPWDSIILIIAGLLYFLSPIDLIPDWIPVAGYLDDAAVIAFVVASIRNDLYNFTQWEAEHANA